MNFINYNVSERVAYITLNRPDKRNALNFDVVSELKDAFLDAEQDPNVKVVVLRANGKVFCAGADLEYLQQLQKNSYADNLADSSHLKDLFHQIYTHKKVVIAQIHGHAIAGGCGLATVCDISFSAPEAQFGYTEVRIGFVPAIVTIFLLRKIGETRAKEMLLSGELISAKKAEEYGLINFIVPADEIEKRVFEYAQMVCKQNSMQSLQLTKKMIAEVQEKDLTEALTYAAQMNAHARETTDCKRGIGAFVNKETLEW